jgi:hypothetical protein
MTQHWGFYYDAKIGVACTERIQRVGWLQILKRFMIGYA